LIKESESKILGNLAELQNPFGIFCDVKMLEEQLEKRLCFGLVIFEKRFGIFINQKFGVSKTDWNL